MRATNIAAVLLIAAILMASADGITYRRVVCSTRCIDHFIFAARRRGGRRGGGNGGGRRGGRGPQRCIRDNSESFNSAEAAVAAIEACYQPTRKHFKPENSVGLADSDPSLPVERLQERIDDLDPTEDASRIARLQDKLKRMNEKLASVKECLENAGLDFTEGLTFRDLRATLRDCKAAAQEEEEEN